MIEFKMVKEIYKQLLLSHQIGCITTMNIFNRWQQGRQSTSTDNFSIT
jgi:hypothetical protein